MNCLKCCKVNSVTREKLSHALLVPMKRFKNKLMKHLIVKAKINATSSPRLELDAYISDKNIVVRD